MLELKMKHALTLAHFKLIMEKKIFLIILRTLFLNMGLHTKLQFHATLNKMVC